MCFTFADMAVGVGRILTWFGEGSQHLGCNVLILSPTYHFRCINITFALKGVFWVQRSKIGGKLQRFFCICADKYSAFWISGLIAAQNCLQVVFSATP